ncbi:MAG: ABC transporter ATP-binding protein [Clostridiales Family XIII bacterium]|jgi:branched-chain amino acid transport system ATP-binding protein|nr:ABC transporter ATP-binding protein [Clostridiales Family XIII bacterium]
MLDVIGVTKKFGGLVANKDVTFRLEEGEILGFIGSNGSGKTTMFNMITGFLKPTEGGILFRGEDLTRYKAHEIVYKGIARTFQLTSILPDLTVEDNVLYGLYSGVNTSFLSGIVASKGYREQERAARERVDRALELLKLDHRRTEPAKNIASAEQRKLMIAIAMARKPKLLLLDEPAAGTSPEEQDELVKTIRKIRDDGASVLIIEHSMRLIMQLCDHIVAFNFGEKIGDGTPDEIKNNQAVIDAYLGRAD